MRKKQRKQKVNGVKIFVVMVLAMICLGCIITLRNHPRISETDTDGNYSSEYKERIKNMVKNDKQYP